MTPLERLINADTILFEKFDFILKIEGDITQRDTPVALSNLCIPKQSGLLRFSIDPVRHLGLPAEGIIILLFIGKVYDVNGEKIIQWEISNNGAGHLGSITTKLKYGNPQITAQDCGGNFRSVGAVIESDTTSQVNDLTYVAETSETFKTLDATNPKGATIKTVTIRNRYQFYLSNINVIGNANDDYVDFNAEIHISQTDCGTAGTVGGTGGFYA